MSIRSFDLRLSRFSLGTPFLGVLAGLAVASQALAQSAPAAQTSPDQPAAEQQQPAVSTKKDLWHRDQLFGDLGGIRSKFADKGVTLYMQETSEVLGNPTGGIKQGITYEGALLGILTVDTTKLFGWQQGGTFTASGYEIRGRGLSTFNVDNWNLASSLEFPPSVKLFELWYEQPILDGKVSIRIGQMAADQEFIVSKYAPLFLNSAFGWPTLPGLILPEGGPAYPLGTPGIRLKVQPTDSLALLAAAFNGNPNDNGSGTSFTLDKGVFAIAEAQYSINGGDNAPGLPGTYHLGAWYNSNEFDFDDERRGGPPFELPGIDNDILTSEHKGDFSIYAMADQMLYRVAGTKDQGLGVFTRIMGAPEDRNVISFYLDAGLNYKGLIPGRGDDIAGLSVAYAKASGVLSQLSQQAAMTSGYPLPNRDAETLIEATYQYQVTPWWYLQPDFQYVFDPQALIPDPNNPTRPVPDAAIFALRTAIRF
ncbi:MAG: carbohydrate porin [Methylovirgula sp.]|jgi:porin